ncbi:LacI family transcriptional regulator [Clostridiales bacterium COT073_COT-073]|nr:LacI family transcriptional regulator [Clostridiales bacterium COT073_COT-073]
MATLKEVADLAGVSPITVSRVINNPDAVKDQTRQRIEAVMQELKYSPNLAAKNLATNRSGIIDVYIPENIDLSNPFVMHLIAGISQVLSEQYYSFLILRNRRREHVCDGYIVTGLLKNEIQEFVQYAKDRNRPIILFGHTMIPDIDCIDVDNVLGAKRGTEYLIVQGHKQIAMINVFEDKDYTVDRLEGYKQALTENGITYDPKLVFYTANSVDGGEEITAEIVKKQKVSAIFCATDTIAIGVAAKLKSMGYLIPQDISLMGFDGLGHQMLAKPQLTTVQQPIYELGVLLAEKLLERLNGRETPVKKTVAPVLLEGNSVCFKN